MEQPDFSEFSEWLKIQPADTSYCGAPSKNCPISRYLSDREGYPVRVGTTIYFSDDSKEDYELPRWATSYINNFDALGQDNQSAALRALDMV
jgi:hypothetical protein